MSPSLEEIQDALLESLHRGEPIDEAAALAAHPEHAHALQGFFRVLDAIETPSAVPDATPARLGDFQIVRELGRGGMGIVYEAVQLTLKRRVALKILPPALGGHGQLALRFRREAEAAARLRHPGIVPVYACGEVAGTPFFAMELVEGHSLAHVIARLRAGDSAGLPSDPSARKRWAVELAARIADALAYAHGEGIVHRDVKPANILLEQDATPRLTDFGLATDVGHEGLTLSGEVFGSPRYMSPEQAFRRQQPIDGRSDVYSLGVTLYELLTLRFPYQGETSSEYLSEVSQGRIVPPRAVDASIPPALERVLLRALAHEPEQRYASAVAFATDLRDLARDWDELTRETGVAAAVATAGPGGAATSPRGDAAEHRAGASRADDDVSLAKAGGSARAKSSKSSRAVTEARAAADSRPDSLETSTSQSAIRIPKTLRNALLIGCGLVTAFVIAPFVISYIWMRAEKSQLLEEISARDQAEHDALNAAPLKGLDFELLADEKHPAGARRLEQVLKISIEMRSMAALDQPLAYEGVLKLAVAAAPPPDVEVLYHWIVSRDGKPSPYGSDWKRFPPQVLPTWEARESLSYEQAIACTEAERASAKPFEVQLDHELELRICRAGKNVGTLFRARFIDPRKVTVVPSFPANYPRKLSGLLLTPQMEAALRPSAGRLSKTTSTLGAMAFECELMLPEDAVPASTAGKLLLRLPDAFTPFAAGEFQVSPSAAATAPLATGGRRMRIELRSADMSADAWQEVLQSLRAPNLKLSVRFESDRGVALSTTTYDEMWYGIVETNVPFDWRE
jgi:serine/threonine protein kinase